MIVALFLACHRDASSDDLVQFSSSEPPSWFVGVSVAAGFAPECKAIGLGDTVQWTNEEPDVPANVTSLGEPVVLYSPNLQGAYVDWAHTFEGAGFFEYYDTNSGDPGRRVVDSYYGTVTYVGTSDTAHRGAVCVPGGEVACCCTALDCGVGQDCVTNVCQ